MPLRRDRAVASVDPAHRSTAGMGGAVALAGRLLTRLEEGSTASPVDPADRWLRRPDVWSGLVLAGALAGRSFRPSLMPRATAHQALVTGASGAIGVALGGGVHGLAARTGNPVGDLAVLSGLAGAGFGVSRLLPDPPPRPLPPGADEHRSPEPSPEPAWRPVARTAGSALAAGGTAAALGVLVRAVPPERRHLAGGALTVLAALTSVREIERGVRAQRAAHDPYDPPPPQPLPAVTQAAGVAAVLTGLVTGFRHTAPTVARVLERRLGVPATASRWLGRGLAVSVWYGVGKAGANAVASSLRVYDRVIDNGFDRAPSSPMRTSGEGSPIPFARLGREGRRFVLNVPEPEEITTIMGTPAVAEPIRVFVGYAAARTDEERVDLALDELRRTGAFDRRYLVVGCPAGNGYVNTLPLEVVDYLGAGDTAAVAVQYGRLPSVLTLQRTTRGGQVHRRLLAGIQTELAARPPAARPTVVVYGESLGAWAGQDAFLHRGVDGLDELGVARALWVGTPFYSGWRREVLVHERVVVPDGSVVEVGGPPALLALDAEARSRLRAVVLQHGNDPVALISAGLIVRRPPWLSVPTPSEAASEGDPDVRRPWGVPPDMGWLPGISAIQIIVDTINATRPVPGVFRATGHEYSADLPDATVVAYGLPEPAPEVWDRLVQHLQEVDAARAPSRHHRSSPDDATSSEAASGSHDGVGGRGTGTGRRGRGGRLARRVRRRHRRSSAVSTAPPTTTASPSATTTPTA